MPVPQSLASRNIHDVICDSGLELTIELLNGRDFIFTGSLPMPVLDKMTELEGATDEERGGAVLRSLSDEERRAWYDHQCKVVSLGIKKAKGEPVDLAPDELGWLSDAEFNQVYAWVTRATELPGKD